MSELRWSNKSSNYIMHQDLVDDDIVAKKDKPTLSTIDNHVIVLPPDTKIEPIIEEYMIRTNYFVGSLFHLNWQKTALWITRITCTFLITNMKTVNQSVSGYAKYTNLMILFGAINHTRL